MLVLCVGHSFRAHADKDFPMRTLPKKFMKNEMKPQSDSKRFQHPTNHVTDPSTSHMSDSKWFPQKENSYIVHASRPLQTSLRLRSLHICSGTLPKSEFKCSTTQNSVRLSEVSKAWCFQIHCKNEEKVITAKTQVPRALH